MLLDFQSFSLMLTSANISISISLYIDRSETLNTEWQWKGICKGPIPAINLSSTVIIKFVILSRYLFTHSLTFNVNMLLLFKTEVNLLYNVGYIIKFIYKLFLRCEFLHWNMFSCFCCSTEEKRVIGQSQYPEWKRTGYHLCVLGTDCCIWIMRNFFGYLFLVVHNVVCIISVTRAIVSSCQRRWIAVIQW